MDDLDEERLAQAVAILNRERHVTRKWVITPPQTDGVCRVVDDIGSVTFLPFEAIAIAEKLDPAFRAAATLSEPGGEAEGPVLEWIPYRSQDQGYIRQEIASHTWTLDDERMVFVARLDQGRDGSLDGIWFLHQGSAEISSDFFPCRSREEGKADLQNRFGLLLRALQGEPK
jgi:hypothetical protein